MPIKSILSVLAPQAERARLSILIFHRVLPRPDPLFPGEVDVHQFDQMLQWVKRWCNVLPLDEAVARLQAGTLPARAAAITFDDGYADNHDIAMPVLQKHGLSATFFIATSYLGGGRMFNDTVIEAVRSTGAETADFSGFGVPPPPGAARWSLATVAERRAAIEAILGAIKYVEPGERRALAGNIAAHLDARLPDDLMMTTAQVRAMRAGGMQIGAHTDTHPILARLDPTAMFEEIVLSKNKLESMLDAPVTLFAYPNGRPVRDYVAASVAAVRKAGFTAAVTTAMGAADRASDLLQLPRFTPWDRTRTRFGLRLAANLMGKRPELV